MRYVPDTTFIKELPDESFPFRLQHVDRDTGDLLHDVVIMGRAAVVMLPVFKDSVKTVQTIITWPDNTIDEQTWKVLPPGDPHSSQPTG